MSSLPGGADMVTCPHCGEEMRRGMVRCRQCGKTPTDSTTEVAGDFELNGHELVQSEEPRCGLCGALLEPGSDDCPSCTSALLDQLLKGPENGAGAAPPSDEQHWPSSAAAELRVRRARSGPPAPKQGLHLREISQSVGSPSRSRSEQRATSRPAEAPRAKPAAQSPARAPAPRKERPARRSPEAAPEPAPEPAYSEPTEEELVAGTTPVETSAACVALLASLAKADVVLRCEIATALGKLGDKQAMGPLERHMGDADVRVRRAVAAALVQLGHPKGQTLLDIAERKPAKEVLVASKPPRKPRSSGGSSIDGGTLKIVLGAVLALALVGGGAWYFWPKSSGSYGKSKKGKAAVTKKAPKKAPVRPKAAD